MAGTAIGLAPVGAGDIGPVGGVAHRQGVLQGHAGTAVPVDPDGIIRRPDRRDLPGDDGRRGHFHRHIGLHVLRIERRIDFDLQRYRWVSIGVYGA